MMASARKLKLNRNIFKDANGLVNVPRRRRPFTPCPSIGTFSGETPQSTIDCMAKTGCVSEPIEAPNHTNQSPSPRQTLPVLADDPPPAFLEGTAPGSSPPSHHDDDGWQRSTHVSPCQGTLKSKGNDLKCKRESYTKGRFEVKVEAPCTRSQYYKCRRFTRSMNQPLKSPTGLSCSLQFALCFCGEIRHKQMKKQTNKTKIARTQKTRESKVAHIHSNQPFKAKAPNSRHAETRPKQSPYNTKNATGRNPSLFPGKVFKTYPLRSLKNSLDSVSGVSVKNIKPEGGSQVCTTEPTGRIRGTLIDPCCHPVNPRLNGLSSERTKSTHSAIANPTATLTGHCPQHKVWVQSETSLRRTSAPSCCALCGDIKYTHLKRRNRVHIQTNVANAPSEEPKVRSKTRRIDTNIQAPTKLTIWVGKYPKVKLCDIAKVFKGSLQDFRCVLPDRLKSKMVFCFKQELGTGVWLGPFSKDRDRCGGGKDGNLSGKECGHPSCQPQRLTPHQQAVRGRWASSTNPIVPLAPVSGKSEGPTNHSVSLLLGQQASRGASGAGMLDKDTEEDPDVGKDLVAAEKRGSKRTLLGNSAKPATVLLDQEQEGSNVRKLGTAHRESMKANRQVAWKPVYAGDINSPVDSRIRDRVDSVNAVKGCDSAKQDGDQRRDPRGSDISQDSSEKGLLSCSPDEARMVCQANGEPAEEALFSCQRVKPFVRQPTFSCARTDMPWPFPACKPLAVTSHLFATRETPTMDFVQSSTRAVGGVSRTGHVQVSAENVLPSHEMTNDIGDTNQRVKSDGEVAKLGEQLDRHWMESYREKPELASSSGRSRKVFRPQLKPLDPFPVSPLEDVKGVIPNLFMLERGSETDTPLYPGPSSTSSPPVGLSDTDTSSVSFPLLFPSTPDSSTYSFSSTTSFNPASLAEHGTRNAGATSSLAASSSSPSSKHADAIPAVPDFCTSGDFSETNTASDELFSGLHSSSLRSLNDSFHSSQSSFLLPQEDGEIRDPKQGGAEEEERSDKVFSRGMLSIPPPEEQRDDLLPSDPMAECDQGTLWSSESRDGSQLAGDDLTPGRLSRASTPTTLSMTSLHPQTQSYLDEEECGGSEALPAGDHTPRLVIDTRYYSDGEEKDEDKEEQASSGDDTNPHRSPSGDEDDDNADDDGDMGERGGRSSEEEEGGTQSLGSPGEEEAEEADEEPRVKPLDELSAYKQDILVVDVIQDDPDLFGNLPEKSLLNLGPTRREGVPGTRATRVQITPPSREPSLALEKSLTSHVIGVSGANTFKRPAAFEDGKIIHRFQNAQASTRPSLNPSHSWTPGHIITQREGQPDGRNVNAKEQAPERIQTLNSRKKNLSLCGQAFQMKFDSGDLQHTTPKSDNYCRFYFKEDTTCTHKSCWYRHLPKEGDEKLCVQTVLRFSNSASLVALQKAAAVFVGYYQSSPPGGFLTPPVLNSLLSILLKAGLISEIINVLGVCALRKMLPRPAFLLALFNHVREKAVLSLVPELMHLTTKMVDAGLVINVEDCKRVLCSREPSPSAPLDAQIPASILHRSPSSKTAISEAKYLSHAIQDVELCAQQEDWCRMGAVFRSVCLSLKSLSELQHFSGCVAVALLTETKDRLALPFVTFSHTVCQGSGEDGLVKSFLGRIGVSLMFRYHKNQQWAKGQKVVEVLSRLKVSYSTLKGLFGNEDGASRCRMVSMATELFLQSGSVEGALNTLRDNMWFLSSSLWPCEPSDVIERTNVLVALAKKTSHRDTLEVLSNLPGLKEPTDVGSSSQYESLFNSHLSVCVERQTLPVAADTLDFMLSKGLAVETPLLHTLLHKLGKQNFWLRARGLFKCALCGGYYPGVSAPSGSLALTVPSGLGEIEMALAFEMFVTLNAAAILSCPETPVCLSISLTRTLDCESRYLSAGSRLLSAAIIPNPKLTIRYQAVSSSNEQVFLLDTPSARRWLQHNGSWASELWPPGNT